MPSPSVSDHVRPTDGDLPDGIYRVVGRTAETVTLLRVTDAAGRRVHTGEVVSVGHERAATFAPAENPDGNRSLGAALASTLETAYWSLRVFGRQLLAHPLPAAVAGAGVAAGLFGDRLASVPDLALGALIFAGSLGLAYVGSGRLG